MALWVKTDLSKHIPKVLFLNKKEKTPLCQQRATGNSIPDSHFNWGEIPKNKNAFMYDLYAQGQSVS